MSRFTGASLRDHHVLRGHKNTSHASSSQKLGAIRYCSQNETVRSPGLATSNRPALVPRPLPYDPYFVCCTDMEFRITLLARCRTQGKLSVT